MGYQTKEVLAGGKTFITVTLSPLNNSLNEIVVTGYTTQLRKDITGSVASVNVSVAKQLLVSNSEQLLQRQAEGVYVVNPQSQFFANGQIPDFGYQQSGGAKGFANAGDPAVDSQKYNYDPSDGTGSNNDYLIQAFNKKGNGTDWFHEAFKYASTQSHSITASGANNKNTCLLSFQYLLINKQPIN